MPGFIGGSSAGSGGTGGEISFPKEFIDPVTKLRVSQPETMIDTDFEYGLQPTKWETVELINNTPSFFSKGGDTTIPNITAIITNAGTREITVTTALEHGLSVGVPISVTGTKSVTADGTYIINSIPNTTTFTYLCRDNQGSTASIEDLYSSIITGEFFQGSQIRVSSASGMVTDAAGTSRITVNTPSAHGFKVNTPFYFLNLNSTVSQTFDSSNTTTKSFDASNSATAQTFDGSNTLAATNIDFSNSAVVGGTTSSISGVNAANNTIDVTHTTEGFLGKPIGTPLYYNVTTSSNYFDVNPRGVVFLKTNNTLGSLSSTFQVSALPDGDAIDITASMTGTFQLANQARTFAGNNVDTALGLEQVIAITNDTAKNFNGTNTGGLFATCTSFPGTATINGVSGSGNADLAWYEGAMVYYTTTGAAPSGLTANTTYFVSNFTQQGTSTTYSFNLKPLPNGSVITVISGGSGTHTFTQIGVSLDRDVFHIQNHGYVANDMLRYSYPAGGKFAVASIDQDKDFYFVSTVYDAHNFNLNQVIGELVPSTDSRTGTNAGTAIAPTTVTAVGFGAGLTYAVTSGTLPPGLALNASTGVVSGTPSAAYSTATVTITATDSANTTGTQVITFQFNPAPNLYNFTTATFGSGGAEGIYGPSTAQARSAVGNPGWASTYLTTSGGTQLWTVPETATYRIYARGASSGGNQYQGGRGVDMRADFPLTQGQVIKILVGQGGRQSPSSDPCNTGAGGGSFVATNANVPIIVAGGGGGMGGYEGTGYDGVTTNQGGTSSNGRPGGTNGGGGASEQGASGAGFYGNGTSAGWGSLGGDNNGVAQSFTNGGYGGSSTQAGQQRTGGFGGGAAGHGNCHIGGPGAGGYGGGGASPSSGNGGGGGSFIASNGTNVATSNGLYNGSSNYNGAITNLGTYNSRSGPGGGYGAPGFVQITKL